MFKWLKSKFNGSSKRIEYVSIAHTLEIKEDKKAAVQLLVVKFLNTRARYGLVSHMTGVPDDVLFAIHYRESSLNFNAVLHNGETIIGTGRKTKLVPSGRGPFDSWESAAIDAMEIEKAKFPKEWDMISKLDFCEKYNGLGYQKRGVPSPYVLSWTNGYTSGKYITDGKYSSSAIDGQCGTAAIILGIANV